MSNEGPKDLQDRFNSLFKQPRSRRGRASARRQATVSRTPVDSTTEPAVTTTLAQKLKLGDVFKGWYGRQVVLGIEFDEGLVHVTYRKVRKDRSIIESGEPVTTTLKVDAPIRVLEHINIQNPGIRPEKGSTTMAKTVTRKGGSKTAAKKSTAKPKAAKKESTRRSAEDVDALVPAFVDHLNDGGTMRDLKQEHGFSDDGPIRAALYRNGYDSKGNEHEEERGSIDASKVAGKKQLVKLRVEEGAAWFRLAYLADITEAEAKKIVADAGGPTGRVYVAKEKPAKAAPKGKTAAKSKSQAAKRAAKKAADEDPS